MTGGIESRRGGEGGRAIEGRCGDGISCLVAVMLFCIEPCSENRISCHVESSIQSQVVDVVHLLVVHLFVVQVDGLQEV